MYLSAPCRWEVVFQKTLWGSGLLCFPACTCECLCFKEGFTVGFHLRPPVVYFGSAYRGYSPSIPEAHSWGRRQCAVWEGPRTRGRKTWAWVWPHKSLILDKSPSLSGHQLCYIITRWGNQDTRWLLSYVRILKCPK